jgi:hypothetical protein
MVQNLDESKSFGSKNLSSFTVKFSSGLNERWHKFHSFCMNESEQNEAKG